MTFFGRIRARPRLGLAQTATVIVLTISSFHRDASAHPCKSKAIENGKLIKGAAISLFNITNDNRRFKLGGLLVTGNDTVVSSSEEFSFHAANDKPDRYGRIGTQAFTKDGKWLQGRLLEQGRAFQFGLDEKSDCIVAMRQAEHRAREAKSGVWATDPPVFETKNTDALLQQAGKFAIIKGTVRSVGDRKRRLYLNFGSNWSEDVTAVVVKTGSGAYRGDVALLQQLEGKRVEIRGVVEDAQGPLIRLIDEAQIDILDR